MTDFWIAFLLGAMSAAPFAFMLGSFLTRIKIDDELESARWLAERIERGFAEDR